MSLYSSMYSAISGLNSNSTMLSVISDNVANMNTIGYKRSRANFGDMIPYTVTGVGSPSYIGAGSELLNVEQDMTAGGYASTGNGLDLAISGGGFFVVKGANNSSASYYTRAGQFHVDKDGFLVNATSMRVQGYTASNQGVIGGTLGDLQFKITGSPASPTTSLDLYANLDSGASTIAGGFNPMNGGTFSDTLAKQTSNFSTSMTVYDSLGAARDVTMYYTKTGANTWSYNAVVNGSDSASGNTEVQATGTLTFDSAGKLVSTNPNPPTGSFNFAGAQANQAITLNLGDPTANGGTGLAGMTQFSSDSAVTYQSQNGYGTGSLQSVSVDEKGQVTGSFSNGQSRVLGQVALATFQGQGLQRMGTNLWQETTESGQASIGTAKTGSRGSITASTLEQANVDLSSEFVDMITAQRGYQANSRTITTADSLLQEAMNMKR